MSNSYTSISLTDYTTSYPTSGYTGGYTVSNSPGTHAVTASVPGSSFDAVMGKMANNLYRSATLGDYRPGVDVLLSKLFGNEEYEFTIAASVENIISDFIPDSDKTLSRDIAKAVVQDIFQSMRKELDINVNL